MLQIPRRNRHFMGKARRNRDPALDCGPPQVLQMVNAAGRSILPSPVCDAAIRRQGSAEST
jgi:hypothetical protein